MSEFASDREIVAAMLAGDETAFRSFFDGYFPRVYRFAMPRLGGDVEASKEVVQATFVKAMQGLAGYRGEAALFSWLCKICRHQVIDYMRANKKHVDNIVVFDDNAELRAALETVEASRREQPDRHYDAQQTRAIVQSVLDRLPGRYGDILEWKYIEGYSVQEIGERLGVGHTAAQSLLARARNAFRDAMETVFGQTAGEVLADIRGQ